MNFHAEKIRKNQFKEKSKIIQHLYKFHTDKIMDTIQFNKLKKTITYEYKRFIPGYPFESNLDIHQYIIKKIIKKFKKEHYGVAILKNPKDSQSVLIEISWTLDYDKTDLNTYLAELLHVIYTKIKESSANHNTSIKFTVPNHIRYKTDMIVKMVCKYLEDKKFTVNIENHDKRQNLIISW